MKLGKITMILTWAAALIASVTVMMGYPLLMSSEFGGSSGVGRVVWTSLQTAVWWFVIDLLVKRVRAQVAAASTPLNVGPAVLRPVSAAFGVFLFVRALVFMALATAGLVVVAGLFSHKVSTGGMPMRLEAWVAAVITIGYWAFFAPALRRKSWVRGGRGLASYELIPGGVRIRLQQVSIGQVANDTFDVQFAELSEVRLLGDWEAEAIVYQASAGNLVVMAEDIKGQIDLARNTARPNILLKASGGLPNLLLRGPKVLYVLALDQDSGDSVVTAFQQFKTAVS
jgi:hypothetical protein